MIGKVLKLRMREERKERRKEKNLFTENDTFYSGELKYFKIRRERSHK
jgi:hypothetical protein